MAESTLLAALLANESGGRNINNTTQGTSSGQAQGYFQITTGTWDEFGGRQFAPNPQAATYAEQANIASRIPLRRWDSSTIARMRATGRPFDISKTFGQNLAANGESFSDFNPGTREFAKGSSSKPGAPVIAVAQTQAPAPQTAAPPNMGSMLGQALAGMSTPASGGGEGLNNAMLAQAQPAAPGPQLAFRAAADDAANASNLTAGGPSAPDAAGQPGTGAPGMRGLLGLMTDPNAQSPIETPTDVPMTGMSGLLYSGGAGLGVRRPAVTRLT